ncbi:clathrin adaptor mu subunit [Ramicandelaber brevisporus]|nr:clathrin adaptor mu subunit [Ramicandelaber brevisporus]
MVPGRKGEVLISRVFRPDVKRSVAELFRIHALSASSRASSSPVTTLPGSSTSFLHVRFDQLYIVAVTKHNANAALVFEFLYRFVQLSHSYFGKLDEESVKSNFVLIYELLDEILDFGYPQNTEPDTLKMYVTTETSSMTSEIPAAITSQATGIISWRRSDIRYKKNEAFIDVIESVNMLMSAQGTVLRADVVGHVIMRAYLSGMPECRFGLNDKLLLEHGVSNIGTGSSDQVEIADVQFHQCVRLGKFDADRMISFIPPDGEFELMRYRTTENINLPFRVQPVVSENHLKTRIEYQILVKGNFSNKLSATSVVLRIPTPPNATKCKIQSSVGKAKYEPSENAIVWRIAKFPGAAEHMLSAKVDLTPMTVHKVWSRPPIAMNFHILMFTSSGLLVRYLKVTERSGYQSVKWVRYMTQASAAGYLIRF